MSRPTDPQTLHLPDSQSVSVSQCVRVLSVRAEAAALCSVLSETAEAGRSLDVSPELTRAVTNVVCALCFSSSYRRGDPEFEDMLVYSQGIVDTVAKDSLVDVFPWLQVHF